MKKKFKGLYFNETKNKIRFMIDDDVFQVDILDENFNITGFIKINEQSDYEKIDYIFIENFINKTTTIIISLDGHSCYTIASSLPFTTQDDIQKKISIKPCNKVMTGYKKI